MKGERSLTLERLMRKSTVERKYKKAMRGRRGRSSVERRDLAGAKQGPILREHSLADDWRVGALQHFGAPDHREISGDDGVTVPRLGIA